MEGWVWAAIISSQLLMSYEGVDSTTTIHSENLLDEYNHPLVWRTPDDCMIWISRYIQHNMTSYPNEIGCKRMLSSEVKK